jgi:LysR family cys regulon transcriptional activator
VAYIGFRRGTFLRRYMLSFIKLFAPHLDEWTVQDALACKTRKERVELFAKTSLPHK